MFFGMKVLLVNLVNIDAKNERDQTALMVATLFNRTQILEVRLQVHNVQGL